MFRSLFGKKKKGRSSDSLPPDESIRSAGVGDVVVIGGFSPTFADAYFIVELVSRYESPVGKSYELMGVDGDRRVAINWSDDGGLFISVAEQDAPMGLSVLGVTEEELGRMDESHSLDSSLTYDGETYFYKNSHNVTYYKDNGREGQDFWGWEFSDDEGKKMISVVKWDEMPFEVYTSKAVSPDIVNVYKK